MIFDDKRAINKNMNSAGRRLISRRHFLKKTTIAVAGISTLGVTSVTGRSKTTHTLRVISYNVYGCTGWPRDQKMAQKAVNKKQMATRIAQELALYDPDIITFSESPDESITMEIARQLDMNHVRFPSAGDWPGTLLTRFEIVDSENVPIANGSRPDDLYTRHWGMATVRLPGGALVVVHSVHLYPHDTPEARAVRKREISGILEVMQANIAENRSILVLGDLNHSPEMPGYKQWMNAGWTDTFTKAGKGEGLTIRVDEPARRIDYILAHGPIANAVIESRPLFEGAFRTNPADPNSFALSDHLPQLAVFELSEP